MSGIINFTNEVNLHFFITKAVALDTETLIKKPLISVGFLSYKLMENQ